MTCPTKILPKFGLGYFQSGSYAHYAERKPRYLRMAREIESCLRLHKLINCNSTLLDFGCGFGFLATGLADMGYSVSGYEVSREARKQAEINDVHMIDFAHQDFDFVIALDVLEHMRDAEISRSFSVFRSGYALVRIPCARPNEKEFFLEVSRTDPTHINCKDKSGWFKMFRRLGFQFFTALDLCTIYDEIGVLAGIFSRDPLRLHRTESR